VEQYGQQAMLERLERLPSGKSFWSAVILGKQRDIG
jgi:hypothetical protein